MHNKFSNTKRLDPARTLKLVEKNDTWFFKNSRFKFINEHKSLRPGMMHVLLGTTGSGKSTLSRTILSDLSRESKVLFYSTEETPDQFQAQAGYSTKINLENIRFIHETDVRKEAKSADNIESFISQLKWAIEVEKPNVFFFDNITTSVFYDQNKKALETANLLRALMVESDIPFFVIAHTASTIKDNMWFDASNMRGIRSIANMAEYLYCLFRFRAVIMGQEQTAAFVHVDKSRMHNGAKYIYRLFYDHASRDYTSDELVNYAKAIEYIKGK